MSRQVVRWANYHVPVSTFTQAVVVPAGSDLVFVSGITARQGADGDLLRGGDIVAQSRLILENMRSILAEAGATLDDVVKTTTFVRDADQIDRYRAVRDEFFGATPPASSIVEVSRLYDPAMLVEVEAIAAVRGRKDGA
jgi:enamine deaminase RidA (YjgF/YER057c/UK114 family)